ncbi:MAG TPA: thioredoxin-disulfide reductase [Solirubrobacteraceae bacterium]|nr:thioredoxin-disulfide reductase [Solirubrobacteraceae bacterium]
MERGIERIVIVGSGPAGYTAALYAARAELEPLVVEGFAWGGLLQQTTDVENYPGFPSGITGPELMSALRAQAERFGARLITDDATAIQLSADASQPHRVLLGDDVHLTRTVVLAMGAQHRKLGVPGEEELAGRGVSYCATCDAAFFKQVPTMVVGGGDSAMEEAIFLAKFASRVVVVHRRQEFRASRIMLERARSVPNIDWLTPYAVEELAPDGDGRSLAVARLRNTADGTRRSLEVSGAFIAIGHEPQSQLVAGQVELDDAGYVVTRGRSTRTSVPGVFAAGDLVDHTYRQAITAAGSGCQAALDAEWYLRDNPAPAGWSAGAHVSPRPAAAAQ